MKEFLSQKGVHFTEKNIAEDEFARDELMSMGYMKAPLLQIDGETFIDFDRNKIEEALSR